MHLCSFTIRRVGLQPGLETDVHLLQMPVDRLRGVVISSDVLGLTKDVCPTALEVATEDWIGRPAVTGDRSREVLASG